MNSDDTLGARGPEATESPSHIVVPQARISVATTASSVVRARRLWGSDPPHR